MPDTTKRKDFFKETGASGLEMFGGNVYQDPITILQGVNGAMVYQQMANNDPIIGAMLFAIKSIIKQLEWTVDSASENPEDEKNADFVRECMDDMGFGFADYILDMLSFLEHGFSVTEIVYKYRKGYRGIDGYDSKYNDGKIGWMKLPGRSQVSILNGKWLTDDEEKQIIGLEQQPTTGGTFKLLKQKYIHLRTSIAMDNPEGKSILRTAYRPWYMKTRIENYESIGAERDLAGLPVVWAPVEWYNSEHPNHKQIDVLKNVATSVKRDEQEGMVLPLVRDQHGNKLIEFELLNSGGRRQFDTSKIIERKNQEILTTILADFIVLGHGNVGSHALAYSKEEIFQTAIRSFVKIIEDGFNTQAIPRLMRMNGFTGDMPELKASGVDKVDTALFLQNLKTVSDIGYAYLLDERVAKRIAQIMDLPEVETNVGGGGSIARPDGSSLPEGTPKDQIAAKIKEKENEESGSGVQSSQS